MIRHDDKRTEIDTLMSHGKREGLDNHFEQFRTKHRFLWSQGLRDEESRSGIIHPVKAQLLGMGV